MCKMVKSMSIPKLMFNNGYPLRIIFRNDTKKEWETKNPVLFENEIIVVRYKWGLRYKLGNGTDPYKKLPFVSLEHCLKNGFVYSRQQKTIKIELVSENT